MLKVKIFVNDTKIDQVNIGRVEGERGEVCTYRVFGQGDIYTITHDYNDGWAVLVEKALNAINDGNKK